MILFFLIWDGGYECFVYVYFFEKKKIVENKIY